MILLDSSFENTIRPNAELFSLGRQPPGKSRHGYRNIHWLHQFLPHPSRHYPLPRPQFIPQFKLAWRLRHELDYTSINSWTLGSQAVILVLVGISWRIRLGKVRFGYASEWVIRGPYDWYMMIGKRCLPFVVNGLGQALLFAI